jgi:hypothetical protein
LLLDDTTNGIACDGHPARPSPAVHYGIAYSSHQRRLEMRRKR